MSNLAILKEKGAEGAKSIPCKISEYDPTDILLEMYCDFDELTNQTFPGELSKEKFSYIDNRMCAYSIELYERIKHIANYNNASIFDIGRMLAKYMFDINVLNDFGAFKVKDDDSVKNYLCNMFAEMKGILYQKAPAGKASFDLTNLIY